MTKEHCNFCLTISQRTDKKKNKKINIQIEDLLKLAVLFRCARLTQTNMDHRSQHRLRQMFF